MLDEARMIVALAINANVYIGVNSQSMGNRNV